MGHGAVLSGAAEEVRRLSRHLDAPVATTVHGLGVLPARSPLNLGMIGMHGSMGANIAAHLADVVVALGARFDDRVVGARPQTFAAGARIIHVDLDATQLNRVRQVDVAIHGDVRQVARLLLEAIPAGSGALGAAGVDRAAWLARLEELRQAMPTASYDDPAGGDPQPRVRLRRAGRCPGVPPGGGRGARDVIATFDVGTHQMKGAQWFPVSRPRSFLTSGGMGSMGCALPMAVGAWFARPEATVFACVGDGGFVMSSHELDTIGGYGIPVKIVLFDDSLLGMVTNWHSLFFGGRKLTSDRRRGRPQEATDVAWLKETLLRRIGAAETADDLAAALCAATAELAEGEWPLFAATGAAYGIPSERVHTKAQYRAALGRALATPGPYLIHVVLPTQAQVYPLIEPGTTPQDIIWRETAPGSGVRVYAREHFDFEAGHLHPAPLQAEPSPLPTPAAAGAPPAPLVSSASPDPGSF